MKKFLLPLLLLIGLAASAQIPGSTLINSRYEWLGGKFKQLKIPAYSDTTQYPNWLPRVAGDIMIDTVGADSGLYVRYGQPPYWHKAGQGGSSGSFVGDSVTLGPQFYISGDTLYVTGTGGGFTGDSLTLSAQFYISGDTLYVTGTGGGGIAPSDTTAMLNPYIRDRGYGLLRSGRALYFDSTTVFPQIRATIPASAATPKTQHILWSGQSNAAGANEGEVDSLPNPKVLGWDPTVNKWRMLQRGQFPMGSFTPGVHWSTGGFPAGYDTATNAAFYFAKRLQEQTGDTIKVFLVTYGGQSINNWLTTGNNFNDIKAQIAAAGSPRINYFGWQQGEADFTGMNDVTYLARMNTLTARLDSQSWFSKSTPIYIATVLRAIFNINAIQKAIASGMYDKRYTLIDMSDEPQIGDNLHFTATAQYNAANKVMQTIRNPLQLANRFRITQANERGIIAAHTPTIGIGVITMDSTTKQIYQFDGTGWRAMTPDPLTSITLTENNINTTQPLRLENTAGTLGTNNMYFGVLGSVGASITDWPNNGLIETNRGMTISAYGGDVTLQGGPSRVSIIKALSNGYARIMTRLGIGTNLPDSTIHTTEGIHARGIRADGQISSGTLQSDNLVLQTGAQMYPSATGIITAVKGDNSYITATKIVANTTLTNNFSTVLVDATSGNITITLPNAATYYNSALAPAAGSGMGIMYRIKKTDASANTVTIAGTIDGTTNRVINTQFSGYTLQTDGTSWWVIGTF